MDFHDLIILTLKRLPDKTWFEIIKKNYADYGNKRNENTSARGLRN